MKYKVFYSGFAYVEADSPDAAEDKYWISESVYEEEEITEVVEVEEFSVCL